MTMGEGLASKCDARNPHWVRMETGNTYKAICLDAVPGLKAACGCYHNRMEVAPRIIGKATGPTRGLGRIGGLPTKTWGAKGWGGEGNTKEQRNPAKSPIGEGEMQKAPGQT